MTFFVILCNFITYKMQSSRLKDFGGQPRRFEDQEATTELRGYRELIQSVELSGSSLNSKSEGDIVPLPGEAVDQTVEFLKSLHEYERTSPHEISQVVIDPSDGRSFEQVGATYHPPSKKKQLDLRPSFSFDNTVRYICIFKND